MEFKLNMNRFSVVDKVYFFKQTSELISSNLISTTISKDKLFRDFRKLEGRLKTEHDEKKDLQIKKIELEKKIVEINQGAGNESMNKIIQEKKAFTKGGARSAANQRFNHKCQEKKASSSFYKTMQFQGDNH